MPEYSAKPRVVMQRLKSTGIATKTPSPQGNIVKRDNPIGTCSVTCGALNVRSGPDINSTRIGGLTRGKTVQVYEAKNGWLKIGYGADYGWISQKYTDYKPEPQQPTPEPKPPAFQSFEVVITASTLNVRTGPGINNPSIGYMHEGERTTVTGESNGWYKISFNGQEGWISSKYAQKPGEAPPPGQTDDKALRAGQTAAETAKSLKAKYVSEKWTYSQPMRTKNGHYDCSSFCHRCWVPAGVSFNWAVAASQAKRLSDKGAKVASRKDVKPGDLIFYKYGNKDNGRFMGINHVAIAIGGGRRIDAGKTPVREESSLGSSIVFMGRPGKLL